MFINKFQFKNKKVEVEIESNLYFSDSNSFVFGYPLTKDLSEINSSNIHEIIHNINGYFLIIYVSDDDFLVANDITGGFRLYYCETSEGYFLSDNFQSVLNRYSQFVDLEINQNEIDFWRRQDYTSGGRTFFKGVNKLQPGMVLNFDPKVSKSNFYFKDVFNNPNIKEYSKVVHKSISDSFKILKERDESVVLMFSGGLDSTLLALELIAQEINFTPVFFHLKPSFTVADDDFIKCKFISEKLGLKTRYIDVDWEKEFSDYSAIVKELLVNRHVAVGHYATARIIAKEFGFNVTIVNGQGADSIFSYGPTSKGFTDILVRVMYYTKSMTRAYLIDLVLQFLQFFRKRTGKYYKYYNPQSRNGLLAFFDGAGYLPILNVLRDKHSLIYSMNIVDSVTSKLNDWNAKMMALKIHGFLQGPANQVVYRSFIHNNIHKVLLPYCSSEIIHGTVKFRNNLWDIFYPKYVVSDIVNNYFGFNYPGNFPKSNKNKDEKTVDISIIQNSSNLKYELELDNLLSTYKKA
jgi:hypothetical protein